MALEFEDDAQSQAIAAEWEVDVDLLDAADWELESLDSNDGLTVGYIVRFNENTDRELLDQLGVLPGEFYRELSLNAFDQPDDEDEYELYRARTDANRERGLGTGASFVGSTFAGDAFALEDHAAANLTRNEIDDDSYSLTAPFPDTSELIDQDFPLPEPENRPKNGRRAYFIGEERFTPSQFQRLSSRRKVEAIIQWFHDNYEDPAVRTPYESAEGGYQWIWGGPYDAREEIGDQFSDLADDDIIERAVQEVEKDGLVDWAPKEVLDDFDDVELPEDDPPPDSLAGIAGSNFRSGSNFSNFTFAESQRPRRRTPRIRSERNRVSVSRSDEMRDSGPPVAELLTRIERLEAALQIYDQNLPPRNHNNPPELVEPDPITATDFKLVLEAVVELKLDTQKDTLTVEKLEAKASLFRRVAGSIAAWCGRKLDAAVDATIQWGVPIGITWIASNPQEVQAALTAVAETASEWAKYLAALSG